MTCVALVLAAYEWMTAGGGSRMPDHPASNGTAPPCSDDEYLAKRVDNLCHTCDDCVPGQMCTREGAYAGCHDCPEGLYDHDYEPLTACADCPDGMTSLLGQTTCEEPRKDIWDIISILGEIGGGGMVCGLVAWFYDRIHPSGYAKMPKAEDVDRDSVNP